MSRINPFDWKYGDLSSFSSESLLSLSDNVERAKIETTGLNRLLGLERLSNKIHAELDRRTKPHEPPPPPLPTLMEKFQAVKEVMQAESQATAIKPAVASTPKRIVYQQPIPEQYLLAEAFMTVAQKALPMPQYQRLLALAVDRRTVETGKSVHLHSSAEGSRNGRQ